MKNFIEEFKAFALKGNVIDLAVAVVIGTAFGKIVDSFVNDLIMPAIGLIGKFDFATLVLADQVKLGMFINNVVNFLIIAVVVFMAIKALNKVTKKDTTQK